MHPVNMGLPYPNAPPHPPQHWHCQTEGWPPNTQMLLIGGRDRSPGGPAPHPAPPHHPRNNLPLSAPPIKPPLDSINHQDSTKPPSAVSQKNRGKVKPGGKGGVPVGLSRAWVEGNGEGKLGTEGGCPPGLCLQ